MKKSQANCVPSAKEVQRVLSEVKFNPREQGLNSVIYGVCNPDYYEQHAIVMIKEAQGSDTHALELIDAIRLLTLAVALRTKV